MWSETWSAHNAIDGDPKTAWSSAKAATLPIDLVFSFFGREPVLITGLFVNPAGRTPPSGRTRSTWRPGRR